jgi:hypothetical protein
MITENEKNELSKLNECEKELYSDRVKIGVKNELGLQTPDETAIIRKLLAQLLSEFSDLKLYVKGEGMSGEPVTDFIVYNANVEQIKVKAKEDTQ